MGFNSAFKGLIPTHFSNKILNLPSTRHYKTGVSCQPNFNPNTVSGCIIYHTVGQLETPLLCLSNTVNVQSLNDLGRCEWHLLYLIRLNSIKNKIITQQLASFVAIHSYRPSSVRRRFEIERVPIISLLSLSLVFSTTMRSSLCCPFTKRSGDVNFLKVHKKHNWWQLQ
jgi:hypothetical protein